MTAPLRVGRSRSPAPRALPYGVRLLEVLVARRHGCRSGSITSSHGMRLLRGRVRDRLARRAARGHRRRLELGHAVSRRRPRRAARVGLAAHARHGDLSLLDGHGGGHRGRHQPLAGGARGRRDAQGAAEAHPGAARDAALAGAPAEPRRGHRGGRGGHPRRARVLPPARPRSPSWWTSSCSGCWISSSSTSRSPGAGPATRPDPPQGSIPRQVGHAVPR